MAKKVLFINQEITPYVPETEMSVMGRELPQKAQEAGYEIRTFMPKWGTINEIRGQLHEVIRLSGLNLIIDETDHPLIIKVASIPQSRIQVYFIDNEDYFCKHKAGEEPEDDYADNGERAIFFARGVLETVKKLRWTPDIIVCQGWMGAVIPLYVKTAYHDEPSFANAKVITSLFSDQLKGELGTNFKNCLEFREAKASILKDYNDKFDFLELGKLALDYSDGVIEATENINKELVDYANNKKIPYLKYQGADYMDAYSKFFEEISPEE
ncbi:MAG: glycogen synthase [Prevotella sp.]|jgi:starch synthase|nr:glycogen synthase [Prevotella sp.]